MVINIPYLITYFSMKCWLCHKVCWIRI